MKLVERVLNREEAGAGAAADAARENRQLVEAVHGHARTLALLAPALRRRGVDETRASLVELMTEMERKFPGSRGAFGLCQRRAFPAPPVARKPEQGAGARGVPRRGRSGCAPHDDAVVPRWPRWPTSWSRRAWQRPTAITISRSIPRCPYLRGQMDTAEREALTARWGEAMRGYVGFLAAAAAPETPRSRRR